MSVPDPATTEWVPIWTSTGQGPPGPAGPTGAQGPQGPIAFIQDEGVARIQRNTLNFVGAGVTVTDDAPGTRTTITVPAVAAAVTSVFTRIGAVVAATGDYTAAQVTNAVSTLGSYADPGWITSLSWGKITGAPTAGVSSVFTRSGAVVATAGDYTAAQVTNAVSTLGSYVDPAWIVSLAWGKIAGAPSTSGYQTPWVGSIDGAGFNLKNAGAISVGTTSVPINKLDVFGTSYGSPATSGAAANGSMRVGTAGHGEVLDIGIMGGGAWLQARNYTAYDSQFSLALNPNGGLVGVGTASPEFPLTLDGTLPILGIRSGGYLLLRPVSNGWDMRLQATGNQINILSGGSLTAPLASFKHGGNVGIGVSDPLQVLSVIGPSNRTTLATSNQLTIGETSNNVDYRLSMGFGLVPNWSGVIQANAGGPAGGILLLQPGGGKCGVATNNPVAPFTVANLSGVYTNNMTLGSASGVIEAFASADNWGLYFGQVNNGNTWIQAGRTDGNATPYHINLQTSGGCVTIGTVTAADGLTIAGLNGPGAYGQLRLVQGPYGAFWRNDGVTLYMMVTAPNDPNGVWNGAFPWLIDLASKAMTVGYRLGVAKGPSYTLDVNGDCNIAGSYRVNGTPIVTGGSPGYYEWAQASTMFTVTGSLIEIPGLALTLHRAGVYLVTTTLHCLGGGDASVFWSHFLNVNGVQNPIDLPYGPGTGTGSEMTVHGSWIISAAVNAVIKIQAKKFGGGGNSQITAGSNLCAVWIV